MIHFRTDLKQKYSYNAEIFTDGTKGADREQPLSLADISANPSTRQCEYIYYII